MSKRRDERLDTFVGVPRERCPLCGSADLKLQRSTRDSRDQWQRYLKCLNCGYNPRYVYFVEDDDADVGIQRPNFGWSAKGGG